MDFNCIIHPWFCATEYLLYIYYNIWFAAFQYTIECFANAASWKLCKGMFLFLNALQCQHSHWSRSIILATLLQCHILFK
jgi:hypothetical protein